MKKPLLTLLTAAVTLSGQAITLFPFFTDVAGDYKDGATPELTEIGIVCMYSKKPVFFSSLKEADAFLQDVLPFSNEIILRTENDKDEEIRCVAYKSPMLYDVVSVIYLFEIPEKGFFVAYNEFETSPQ